MTKSPSFHDALNRLAQVGSAPGASLVRIVEVDQANRYTARPVEIDGDGQIVLVGEDTLTVINLAEPADAAGQVPADTDAVAIDVEGRWVVFLRPDEAPMFFVKIISSVSGCAYMVREQVATGGATFADKQGASDIAAYNLAELSLGPGAAVDAGTIVIATSLLDTGTPPAVRHFFDHPVYAKYLD